MVSKFIQWVVFFLVASANLSGAFASELTPGEEAWLNQAKNRCLPPSASEKILYYHDFFHGMSRDEMRDKYQEIYHSGKRLKARAFFDQTKGEFILPREWGSEKQRIRLGNQFLKSVRLHIENALKLKYIDYVFFPDMGHSHMLVPRDFYNREIAPFPPAEMNLGYEKMLNYPEMKFLYHTAEQLKMYDENHVTIADRYLQWRFFTRNLVGDNMGRGQMEIYSALDTPGNAASESHALGARWFAGFNISASADGCFSFEQDGKTVYYDLSLEDLPPDPTRPGGFDF